MSSESHTALLCHLCNSELEEIPVPADHGFNYEPEKAWRCSRTECIMHNRPIFSWIDKWGNDMADELFDGFGYV